MKCRIRRPGTLWQLDTGPRQLALRRGTDSAGQMPEAKRQHGLRDTRFNGLLHGKEHTLRRLFDLPGIHIVSKRQTVDSGHVSGRPDLGAVRALTAFCRKKIFPRDFPGFILLGWR